MRAKILFLCGCPLGLKRVYSCPVHGQPIDLETIRARKKPAPRLPRSARKINPTRETEKRLDSLFSDLVKKRADYTDEVTGRKENIKNMVCHHLISRRVRRLRWDFQNGACCSRGTHAFRFHGPSIEREKAEEIIYAQRPGVREYLDLNKRIRGGRIDLGLVEIMLRQESERLKKVDGQNV